MKNLPLKFRAVPVVTYKPKSLISGDPAGYTVAVHFPFAGVDRPTTYSISCGASQCTAERVAEAVLAGDFAVVHGVRSDVNGRTYVAMSPQVIGRYLEKDLEDLGYGRKAVAS